MADQGTKRCSRCGITRPLDGFAIKDHRTGLRVAWCRECTRAYGREHYRLNKAAYLQRARKRRPGDHERVRAAVAEHLRAHPCIDCGEPDILLLDFDHRDGSAKRAAVGRLIVSSSLAIVMAEIAKCDVRCAKCHRIRTTAQRNWRKSPTFDASRRAVLPPPRQAPRASSTGKPVTEQLSIWSVGVTKWCSRCAQHKPLHDFAFHDRATGLRQHRCRACQAALRREHYVRNREHYLAWGARQTRRKRDEQVPLVHEYLRTHPCVDCGESDIRVLEFDHVDRADKVMPVSMMLGRRSTVALLAEIAKCDVRCVSCHRRRTAEQFKWTKRLGEDGLPYNAA